MAELIGHLGIGIDIFESLMWLEPKVFTEFVESGNVPLARLDDSQDLHGSKNLGNVAGTKGTCRESASSLGPSWTAHLHNPQCSRSSTGPSPRHRACHLLPGQRSGTVFSEDRHPCFDPSFAVRSSCPADPNLQALCPETFFDRPLESICHHGRKCTNAIDRRD
jgi:hypothetical protein